jgi:hypothetical protein
MKLRVMTGTIAVLTMCGASGAFAQNAASNKSFLTHSDTRLTFAPINGTGSSDVVTLFAQPALVKTSSGGALTATVSMETVLSTYNLTTAIVNGGKSSSSSRATIRAWVEVDGVAMEPGDVVFNDRLQATGLTVNLTCTVPNTTCQVGGDITLELFQATKSAQAFTFYLGPLSPTIHQVVVKAQAMIECRNTTGGVIACPTGTLAGYTDASTQAGIGKASLIVEEQQNWAAE